MQFVIVVLKDGIDATSFTLMKTLQAKRVPFFVVQHCMDKLAKNEALDDLFDDDVSAERDQKAWKDRRDKLYANTVQDGVVFPDKAAAHAVMFGVSLLARRGAFVHADQFGTAAHLVTLMEKLHRLAAAHA